MILVSDFLKQMVIFFPYIEKEIEERMKDSFEGQDTIVIEEVVMPNIIDLLKKNQDIDKLEAIFKYFEEVSISADEDLLNTFSVTTLEILGNEINILKVAKEYMGPVTTRLQREADLDLGRMIE